MPYEPKRIEPRWQEYWRERGTFRAIALDRDAKLIRLLPLPPADGDWLAVIGGRVVGRAAAPLAAVRRA